VHDAPLSKAAARQVWTTCARENPATGGLLSRAQALWRGWKARCGVAGEHRLAKLKTAGKLFPLGTLVEGLYQDGSWHPATVEEVLSDGNLLIAWNDGDQQNRIKAPSMLRLL
jgi:hypothetical protein